MANTVILGLGASLGDREFYLRLAILLLHYHPQIQVQKRSSIWGSLPLGEAAKHVFWNMVIEIETDLSPSALLQVVLETEDVLGRTRAVRWSDRTIDIDILLYEEEIIQADCLSIPHPEMLKRGFVIQPLLEIAAHRTHPVKRCSFAELAFPPFSRLWKVGVLSLPSRL